MKKNSKSSTYDILVFSDQHSKQRQFRISKKTLQVSFGVAGVVIVGLVGLSVFLMRNYYHGTRAVTDKQELEQKAEKLLADNDYLWATTSELEQRLGEFQEKTDRLALMVGMEPQGSEEGVGGPDLFGAPYDDYNRPDLGFLKRGIVTLEENLAELDEAFITQADLLDATPSILPVRGWISSGFKYRTDPFTQKKTWHNGVDISCPRGTPIYAPAKGVVIFEGYESDYGNTLQISHENGLVTRFGHMDKTNVRKGHRVKRGDVIGYVGSTGRSTAPHLHYEIHKGDKSVNPMKYVIQEVRGL